jgi:DNA-binding beta-propeller fold protein YncE
VADEDNHRLQVFSKADGAFVRKWGVEGQGDGQFKYPRSVAVDSEHVYVCDEADNPNNRVQVFTKADGTFVRKWGVEGSGDGQFSVPSGVAVDWQYAYVTDFFNNRLQVFS